MTLCHICALDSKVFASLNVNTVRENYHDVTFDVLNISVISPGQIFYFYLSFYSLQTVTILAEKETLTKEIACFMTAKYSCMLLWNPFIAA